MLFYSKLFSSRWVLKKMGVANYVMTPRWLCSCCSWWRCCQNSSEHAAAFDRLSSVKPPSKPYSTWCV